MRALLLAAGNGTRLRPLTNSIPKCLVEIGGRPLLDYWLEMLVENGIEPILVNTHHLSAMVTEYLKQSIYASCVKIVRENELLQTAGTLLKNRSFFGSEPVMMIHADNLSLFNMSTFINAFENRKEGIDITMMTYTTDAPGSCGIVDLDQKGIVKGFYEKVENPPGNLANAAVYILSPAVLEFIASLEKKVVDFSTEVIPKFLGRISTFHNEIYHRDIGTIESLLMARREYPLALTQYNAKKKV